MKLLTLVWLSVHGYSVVFSGDQCRALRQAQIGVSQCRQLFASHRAVSANLSSRTRNATADSSPPALRVSAAQPGADPVVRLDRPLAAQGRPVARAAVPAVPRGRQAVEALQGAPLAILAGAPAQPVATSVLASRSRHRRRRSRRSIQRGRRQVRGKIRMPSGNGDRRIIHGAKPPDTGNGKPPAGFNPGPGGMRGQASPKSSGGAAWGGQAR